MKSSKQLSLYGAVLLTAPALAWGEPFSADLQPLNDSGVEGNANLNLNGDSLDVDINASGLEENQTHPQHIHGLFDDDGNPMDSSVPDMGDDADGDGFIELEAGAASYGPVILPLRGTNGGNGDGTTQQAANGGNGNGNGNNGGVEESAAGGSGDAAANGNNGAAQEIVDAGEAGEVTVSEQQIDDNGNNGDNGSGQTASGNGENGQEGSDQATADNGEEGENGDTQQASGEDDASGEFPVADEDGNILFSASYDLSDEDLFANDFSREDLTPMEQRVIVLHGMSTTEEDGAGTDGEVDGTEGYKEVLPVAAGTIEASAGDQEGAAGQNGEAAQDGATQEIPEPGVLSLLAMGAFAFLSGFGRRLRRVRG